MLLGANLLFPEKKGGLPYDAEVEYLQGDGVAYIDLGYGVTETDTSYLNIGFFANRSSSTSSGGVYGWWTSALSRQDLYLTSTTINFLQNATKRFNDTVNDTDYLEFQIKAGDNFYKKNEEIAQSSTSTVKAKYWAAFFIRTKSATSNTLYGNASYVRMTYIKGGDGIHEFDLIPVRKGSVGYMYDRVSGKLYGNAGEGAFIVGPDKGLPYDAEVEYLESDGVGTYVDTGITIAVDISFTTKFSKASPSVSAYVLGALQGSQILLSCGIQYQIGGGRTAAVSVSTSAHTVSCSYDGAMTIDGVSYPFTTQPSTTAISGRTMYVGCRNLRGVSDGFAAFKMYSLVIRKADVVVRDYIPVRKDGVGYLYDSISGELFGNAGSGAFIVGPDK